jgi:glycosyltransferase involved in cell wall biosynthesis
MEEPFISYLVTCKNEGNIIYQLLSLLNQYKEGNECIILDDYSDDHATKESLQNFLEIDNTFFKLHYHTLNNNYSEHKNYGKSLCKGKYIFQIDADELPSETLLQSLPELIKLNSDVDLFWIPRINNFVGVNQENATQWGWKLTPYKDKLIVNWPDPQGRLFKNLPNLKWERRLHEKIEGAKLFSHLPHAYEFALHHNKTIAKQIETNLRYNREFSSKENEGFKL